MPRTKAKSRAIKFRKPKAWERIPLVKSEPEENPWLPSWAKGTAGAYVRKPSANYKQLLVKVTPEMHVWIARHHENMSKYIRSLVYEDMMKHDIEWLEQHGFPPNVEYPSSVPDIGFTAEDFPVLYHQTRLRQHRVMLQEALSRYREEGSLQNEPKRYSRLRKNT